MNAAALTSSAVPELQLDKPYALKLTAQGGVTFAATAGKADLARRYSGRLGAI